MTRRCDPLRGRALSDFLIQVSAGALVCMLGLSSPAALTSFAQTRITRAQEQRFHEQATAALAHGRFDKAEALIVTRPEGDPAATALRARMLAMRGKYGNAEALLLPVANKEPSGGAGLELGLLLVCVGRAEEVVPYFEAVIETSNRSLCALDQYRPVARRAHSACINRLTPFCTALRSPR